MDGARITPSSRVPPPCSYEAGNCGLRTAPIYFVSFMVLGTLVLVNLFIAVVLDNFLEISESKDKQYMLENIARFSAAWVRYDPRATGQILAVRPFLRKLENWGEIKKRNSKPLFFRPNFEKIVDFRESIFFLSSNY